MTITEFAQLALGSELEPWQLRFLEAIFVRTCRVCGCTEHAACSPPCWWVEPDLCSACQTTQGGA